MKLYLTEKQFKTIISKSVVDSDLNEQDAPSTTTQTTSTGGVSQGYPEVGHWESGVTRGPANQLTKSKWSDVVGSILKRGKANPLK
jgi:hypothetical protein